MTTKNNVEISKSHCFTPFYGWLLIMGLIIFGAYLLFYFDLLEKLLKDDITYLSSIILVLFVAVSIYLGIAAWNLSKQKYYTLDIKKHSSSWAADHLTLLSWQRQQATNESDTLLAKLIETVHRGHTTGWFTSDILIRLGLIGTVIGFVIMLGTIYQLQSNDVDVLQELLSSMGSGMQVALYTTLTGLASGMLVGIQCQWLDRCADSLVSRIIELGMQDSNN